MSSDLIYAGSNLADWTVLIRNGHSKHESALIEFSLFASFSFFISLLIFDMKRHSYDSVAHIHLSTFQVSPVDISSLLNRMEIYSPSTTPLKQSQVLNSSVGMHWINHLTFWQVYSSRDVFINLWLPIHYP